MGFLASIKERLQTKKVQKTSKLGNPFEQNVHVKPEETPKPKRDKKPEEIEQEKRHKVEEKTRSAGKPKEEETKKPKAQEKEQEQPQEPISAKGQPPVSQHLQMAAQAHGFRDAAEYDRAVQTIVKGESIEEFLKTTPEGKDALLCVHTMPSMIKMWQEGKPVPPSVAIGLRKLWTLSQLANPDGKTIANSKLIQGAQTIEKSEKSNLVPLSEGIVKAVRDGAKLKEQLETLDEFGVMVGDTKDIDGIGYRLNSNHRWERSVKDETKERGQSGGMSSKLGTNQHSKPSEEGRKDSFGRTPTEYKQAEKALSKEATPPAMPDDHIAASIVRQSIKGPPPIVTLDSSIKASSLMQHQKEAVASICSAFKRGDSGVLLADGTGLGKTGEILGTIAQMKPKRCIYVVPKKELIESVVGNARKELKGDIEKTGLRGLDIKRGDDTTSDFSGNGIYLTTYASFRENKSLHGAADLVIWDETDALKGTGVTGFEGDALNRASVSKGGKVLFAGATPYQKLEESRYLWPLGLWGANTDRNFNKFLGDMGVSVKEKYNMTDNKYSYEYEHEPSHLTKLLGLHEQMCMKGNYLHRELKLDGLTNEFPTKQLTDEQSTLYNKVMRAMDSATWGKSSSEIRNLKAQKQLVAMRMLEAYMVPHAIELAKKEMKAGRQVAFFTQFVSDLDLKATLLRHGVNQSIIDEVSKLESPADALVKAFGDNNVVKFYGSNSDNLEEYNSGKKKIIVSSYDKGGTGISLHDTTGKAPRTQINLSIPYSAKKYEQVAGRSHRLTSKSKTNQFFMLADVPESKHFAHIVSTKLKHMGAGVRGLEGGDVGAKELLAFELGLEQ